VLRYGLCSIAAEKSKKRQWRTAWKC
jgi:hypothetical protein